MDARVAEHLMKYYTGLIVLKEEDYDEEISDKQREFIERLYDEDRKSKRLRGAQKVSVEPIHGDSVSSSARPKRSRKKAAVSSGNKKGADRHTGGGGA